jgi:CBS domain-containing protein
MWQSAMEASTRIEELKSGIPAGETVVIKDPEEAKAKITKVLESAKEDIIAISSSQSINSLMDNDLFKKYCKKGLRCRIMASIDMDNLETAQKLSANYEIKHVPISYLTMMLVDRKHLFMFKRPPVDEWDNEFFYMPDTFYTNDPSSVEKMSEMLDDTWKRGAELSAISSQAGMQMPSVEVPTTETVSALFDAMYRNGVSSVLITENRRPVGMISDRDLLKEVVEGRKDPKSALAGDLRYTPLITLDSGESIIYALKVMRERGMKRVAMVKNGQLVGMMTEDVALKKAGLPAKKAVPRSDSPVTKWSAST